MKLIRNALVGIAGISLAASPVLAAPSDRGSEAVTESSEMGGTWVGILGVALVVALAAIAAFGGDDDPVSP